MKKIILLAIVALPFIAVAQDEEEDGGFRKENLFAGGGLGLGFGSGYFQVGVNPMLGYSVTPWMDAGIVVNYNYTSFNEWSGFAGKVRQTSVGGGVFTRLYAFRQFFAQAQYEVNSTKLKYLPGNGEPNSSSTVSDPSLLLGIGYAGGRYPGSGQAFGFILLMVDVLGRSDSPYIDSYGSAFPIVRGGIQIPLFQGRRRF